MRRPILTPLVIALALVAAPVAPAGAAELMTKSYQLKLNTVLEVGLDLPGGLRLDSIEFVVPEPTEGRGPTFLGHPKAKVKISNLAQGNTRVGIAIAVLDDGGNLVAAGTGGTKLFPLRAGRQMTYPVPFDDVSSAIARGSSFKVAVEIEP